MSTIDRDDLWIDHRRACRAQTVFYERLCLGVALCFLFAVMTARWTV